MENEIMNNEVVVEEAANEIIEADSKTGLIAAAVCVTLVAGVITWKKIVKPMIAKRKAKKEAKMVEAEYEETVVEENDSEN